MRAKGLLIVVDGPSGSGKDSIVNQILKDLSKLNIQAVPLQETKEKDYDRGKILLAKEFGDRKTAEAIISERRKIYQTKIIPQLSAGKIVITNRGEPTTLAYQTLSKEIIMDDVWKMHRNANMRIPNLIVILNCSVKEALRRENLKESLSDDKDKNSMSGKFTKSSADRKQVHDNYEKVKDFLERKGLPVIYLQNDGLNVHEECKIILNYLKNKLNYLHE